MNSFFFTQTKINAFVILLLAGTNSYLQNPLFNFARQIGGTGQDNGTDIVTDLNGNVYTCGYFQNTVDFDPGLGVYNLSTPGGFNAFISKLDLNGDFVWAIQLDAGYCFGITTDLAGNVYITGQFSTAVDFDPGIGVETLTPGSGAGNSFVLKLDGDGNYIWAKAFQNSGPVGNQPVVINVDNSQNVYVSGYFMATTDFDPGTGITNLTPGGGLDSYVCKLNSDGDLLWVKQISGFAPATSVKIEDMDLDDAGNIYATGYFNNTVDFDPGVGTYTLTGLGSANDIFVLKMNNAGAFQWAVKAGSASTSSETGNGIAVDQDGDVYITGDYSAACDFDPGVGVFTLPGGSSGDCFIWKLSNSGTFIWANKIGSSGPESGQALDIDAENNVYVGGIYSNTTPVDFDPGTGTFDMMGIGTYDIFMVSLDTDGAFRWASGIGGTNLKLIRSIAVSGVDQLYSTGFFEGLCDFGIGSTVYSLTSVSTSEDIFIHSIKSCASLPTIQTISSCTPYTWIDGLTYTTSNNTATYALTNALGCDSIIKLNLTINNVNTGVLQSGLTLTSDLPAATYQWLNCDNGYEPVLGETNQTFTASSNGNYALEISANGCTDTSSCFNINSIGFYNKQDQLFANIYPNPSNAIFNIQLGGVYSNVDLIVTDALGKLILTDHFNNAEHIQLNLHAKQGLYFITIKTNEQRWMPQEIILSN